MRIEVQVFAAAKELVGQDKLFVEVSDDASVGDLAAVMRVRFPALAELLPACRFAIDQCYVADDAPLPRDSEVALIPPVSGG